MSFLFPHLNDLFSHPRFLLPNFPPRLEEKPSLNSPHSYQQEIENPWPPFKDAIRKAFIWLRDGYCGDRYNGYLLVFVVGSCLSAMGIGGAGLYWAIDRGRWGGWVAVVCAGMLAIAGCLSGGLRRLPWDWRNEGKCSRDDQVFLHDAKNRITKTLDYTVYM